MSSIPSEYTYVKTPHHPDSGQTQTPTTPFESMRGLPEPDILDLVDAGLSIIPIERGAKHPPEGFKWRRYQDAPATRNQVQQWQEEYPGCNWAAVWGAVSGGVIAVDIDSPAAFGWCSNQGGFNQNWPVWYATGRVRKITVPGGGELTDWSTETAWQYLFKLPAELADVRGINPHPGVEIRCNGQYSVLPPSVHPSGKRYEWRRYGKIPPAPAWILDQLTGVATEEAVTSLTPQQRPAHSTARTHHGRRPHDITGRNPRLMNSKGYRWLWDTTFPEGSRNSAFFSMAILLRGAGLSMEEATLKLDQWRRTCTSPIYSAQDAAAVIKTTYRTSYGVTVEGLRRAYDIHGEHMPERDALQLTRLFPNMRRQRGERIHEPLFVSIGKILEVLYQRRVMKPTVITNAEMARLAGITESRVSKVTDFLSVIGVRTTTRLGRSTVSTYNLKGLNTPTPQLIKELAMWRGYSVPWKVLASRLWRRVRSLMRAVLSHLNDVFNWLSATWQGETVTAAIGFQEVACEGVSGRAPPE